MFEQNAVHNVWMCKRKETGVWKQYLEEELCVCSLQLILRELFKKGE
jgi:hypothetical protein